ncbi:hypothetical protein NO989_04280 [Alteromonas sp. DY56-G5]|uniref:hypothetical protein n=1 Tax=Alteromonas sp. DY56-G5 TaxID=2967128 RepID=UPI00352AAD64
MLTFKNEDDFSKVDTFKENEDGSISWVWNEGEGLPDHSGIIREGFTRLDSDGNTIDVWQILLFKEQSGEIAIQRLTQEDKDTIAQQEQINQFKVNRQHLLDTAIVTTSLGNQYDADEQSISRMANAILAAQRKDLTNIQWSLADTPTGVMTDVTLADLEEAHELAVENMASIWSI